MRIVWVLRLILFAGVCAFLVCGCSSGKGGTSISPPLTEGFSPDPVFVGSDNVPRDPAITGDLGEVEPLLGWRFTEPADLLDEGWAGEPATIATSLSVSAVLHGTAAEDFDGNVDFHVDGESYPFQFGGSVLTAQVSGLTVGPHQFWVHAIGPGAWASRSLEFEVVNEAPFMQIGVGADDGMLYANLSRRMPKDYLGNLGAWELTGFPCNAVKAEALADGASARIYLSQPLDLDGLWWGQIGDAKAHFQSPLGECEARLIPAHDDTGGERKGQTEGCDQGEVYDCDPEEICCAYPLEWEIECEHRHPLGKEPRQALTCENWADGYRHGDGNWTPPWRNCFDLIVVRHNWIGEAHSNYTLPGSFNLSGDQLWENPLNMGYSGIGYMMGVWQYYYRDFSYYPNSGCPYAFMTLWVDCYNCGGDPPGYKSKGWQVESPLIVDHTNPVFDGIEVIYGAEINDYVGDVLIPDLQSRGIVYTADNQTGDAAYLYTRYMELVGDAIDDDDVVLVVKGDDPLNAGSDQGSWLHDFMGIDFVNGNGQFGYIDEAWEDLFHVDEPPCASQERSSEYWPKCTAGNLWWDEGPPPDLHLHTDGYGQGEYSCWVAPIPCEWFGYQGAKLRIRDDVNNWTHSDNLAPGEGAGIEIVSPEENTKFDLGELVEFKAEITGNSVYQALQGSIQWEILTPDYESIPVEGEDWKGPDFEIYLWDCSLTVKASLAVCGEEYSDTRRVLDPPPIFIYVEEGPYWIDGPSIPTFPPSSLEWHSDSLQTVQTVAWGECYGCDNIVHTMEPVPLLEDTHEGREGLQIGKVKIIIWVPGQRCDPNDAILVEIDGPQLHDEYTITGDDPVPANTFCQDPLVWNILAEDCGDHKIRVKWYCHDEFTGELVYGDYFEEYPLTLSKVVQADLVHIASIYYEPPIPDADWGEGWQCCPGVPGRDSWPGCGDGNPKAKPLIDCCGFVTQLLRRLARCDDGGLPDCYPIDHIGAPAWRYATDRVTIVELGDMRTTLREGDILVWWGYEDYHVAIFRSWTDNPGFPVANTVESWGSNGPGKRTRDVEEENVKGGHWLEGVVFRSCP